MLNDFFVDGIKNLPPPLLPQVINNPSMVNNPHLYVASIPSCRFSKPKMGVIYRLHCYVFKDPN